MRALSMTVPRFALLLSSSGASADTLTLSVMPPTPSCALITATSLVWSRMSVRVYFWNPLISTVTLYSPGRRNGTVYSPWLFDVAVANSPVSWLRTVIVAPGSAAWLESTTCPRTVARNSWAPTLPAMTSSSAAANMPWYDLILIIN